MEKSTDSFADYKAQGHQWITLATGDYYPDVLEDACRLYQPVLEMFGQLIKRSESSTRLFLQISEIRQPWMRIQLSRVFRKYVSPQTPVEMLKKKTKAQEISDQFGKGFRPIQEVQSAFESRPMPDEVLCALLWEYKDRGKRGYDLTEALFELFQSHFPHLRVEGPRRAGQDIRVGTLFADYPNPQRPVDFTVSDPQRKELLAIGLARYDSDRGGAQEDDRTGGYQSCADEVLAYTKAHNLKTKLIFVNDGPGLLLGSMWDDYVKIEDSWPDKIKVITLRMLTKRITESWLKSE